VSDTFLSTVHDRGCDEKPKKLCMMSAPTPEDTVSKDIVKPANIAREVADAIATGAQITPFSMRGTPLELDAAYRSVVDLRALRGGRVIGRKIGFTNRGIWARYGVSSPMWGDVLADTYADLAEKGQSVALFGLAEPRLEPEIALVLAKAPHADMDFAELAECVGWIAPAFEIVQSIYPGWQFDLTDCIVAGALHGRLLLGPRVSAQSLDLEQLPDITVTLCKNGEMVEDGVGANALDGPIQALAHLVALLETDPLNPPLAPGEIVSTGTLTDAWPIAPGETWSARYRGALELEISIRIA
jgi:2-keto-4-pentenoate hydratase